MAERATEKTVAKTAERAGRMLEKVEIMLVRLAEKTTEKAAGMPAEKPARKMAT